MTLKCCNSLWLQPWWIKFHFFSTSDFTLCLEVIQIFIFGSQAKPLWMAGSQLDIGHILNNIQWKWQNTHTPKTYTMNKQPTHTNQSKTKGREALRRLTGMKQFSGFCVIVLLLLTLQEQIRTRLSSSGDLVCLAPFPPLPLCPSHLSVLG